jgi:putative protein-disulfide isomerase
MVATLHYYYDPLCGWCYAAAPLVGAAAALPGITLAMHAGGMMMGAQRRPVTPALRQYVMPHDQRIHAITGQPFGTNYFDGLLRDTSAVLDSAPPISAVLAAEALGEAPLAMLHLLQRAHYVEGRRIADTDVLISLGEDLGLGAPAFRAELERQAGQVVAHVDDSRRGMAEMGLHGFPSLVLEEGGKHVPVDVSGFLGKPEAFATYLSGLSGPTG